MQGKLWAGWAFSCASRLSYAEGLKSCQGSRSNRNSPDFVISEVCYHSGNASRVITVNRKNNFYCIDALLVSVGFDNTGACVCVCVWACVCVCVSWGGGGGGLTEETKKK